MNNTWLIIVNPQSGGGKGLKKWNKSVAQTLTKENIAHQVLFTEGTNHATELTIEAVKNGFRKIVAMGGDGTIHEVTNGILQQNTVPSTDVTMAVIPVGSGNDWIKTMQIPLNIRENVEIIKGGKTYIQDVGVVTYFEGKTQQKRYFLNVAGTGFDAFVAQSMENTKAKVYLWELLKGLINYQNIPVTIKAQGREREETVFAFNVGICQYFGSGMKIAPKAIPDDGWLDVTLIKNISKFGVVKELINLYDGSFVNNPYVETFRSKKITVASENDIYLQLDGELLGHGPIEFSIIPHSLKVQVPLTVEQSILENEQQAVGGSM